MNDMPFSLENLLVASLYLGVIVAIALVVQLLFHYKLIVGEHSRKLIHILSALWMATWRFELTHLEVTYLGLALLAGIFFVKQFKLMGSVFDVDRVTYGESLFVIGIIMTSLIFPDPKVYALAVVNLGLGDGLAAIIGRRYGRIKYDVFGSTKSLVGLLTIFSVAVASGAVFMWQAADYQPQLLFMATHVVASAAVIAGLEFVSFRGLDNLSIPLATGLLYSSLVV